MVCQCRHYYYETTPEYTKSNLEATNLGKRGIQGLSFLKDHSNATIGELAAKLLMSSPAIAKFSDRLVDSGWVERKSDPNDRRVTRLVITLQGKKELEKMQCQHFERMSEIFSQIPEKDIQEMIRIMENLVLRWEEKKK